MKSQSLQGPLVALPLSLFGYNLLWLRDLRILSKICFLLFLASIFLPAPLHSISGWALITVAILTVFDRNKSILHQPNRLKLVQRLNTKNFMFITSISVRHDGEVWVAGFARKVSMFTDHCIERFDAEGNSLPIIKHGVRTPFGMQCYSGDIYTTSFLEFAGVQKVSTKGFFKSKTVIKPPVRCEKVGGRGLAITSDGTVYFIDGSGRYVCRCQTTDNEAHIFAQYSAPMVGENPGMFHLEATTAGDVAVSSWEPARVQVFTKHAKLKLAYEGMLMDKLSKPCGMCTDTNGYLYVADHDNHRVTVVSPGGYFVQHIVAQEEHGIANPSCVQLSADERLLYVSHRDTQIAIFALND